MSTFDIIEYEKLEGLNQEAPTIEMLQYVYMMKIYTNNIEHSKNRMVAGEWCDLHVLSNMVGSLTKRLERRLTQEQIEIARINTNNFISSKIKDTT